MDDQFVVLTNLFHNWKQNTKMDELMISDLEDLLMHRELYGLSRVGTLSLEDVLPALDEAKRLGRIEIERQKITLKWAGFML